MRSLFENHDMRTIRRGQFVDVTEDLEDVVTRSGVNNGMAVVYSPHTTCSVVINEQEQGFMHDFGRFLDELVPVEGRYYRHDDEELRTENLEDPHEIPNGHAHCRGGLLSSSSESIPIHDGRLTLGRWQRVFLVELDRPRDRKVFLQVFGE
jgi:secondary thiamine-phosphate synthase enzyme